jgi:hypothetical protein
MTFMINKRILSKIVRHFVKPAILKALKAVKAVFGVQTPLSPLFLFSHHPRKNSGSNDVFFV